jgi:hypothetical protein
MVIVLFVTITNQTVPYFTWRRGLNLQNFIIISFSNNYAEFIQVIYEQQIIKKRNSLLKINVLAGY